MPSHMLTDSSKFFYSNQGIDATSYMIINCTDNLQGKQAMLKDVSVYK